MRFDSEELVKGNTKNAFAGETRCQPKCRFPYMMPALLVLDARAFGLIYGAQGQAEIERRTRLLAPPFAKEALSIHAEALARVEVIFSGWGAPVMDEVFLAAASNLRAVFYGA